MSEAELTPLQRALVALQKTRAKIEALERTQSEPIALIGMACRFPGGHDPDSVFRALCAGVDSVRRIPEERWPAAALPDASPAVRWAALLDEVDQFDADFFEVSPREATALDPQQRLLLEVAWEALEHAGVRVEPQRGSATGVFIGICNADYRYVLSAAPEPFDAYAATGNAFSTAAGRLSYTFGFQGPCVAIDTACSSSLVAVHQAAQSLRSRECDTALAGGVNLILWPETMELLAQTQALSPDGRCKAFDARANGFVRGEGCGVVVLKRLSDARRDGDAILALLLGSAVNQDGRSTGLTAPNVLSQQRMLRQALDNARVSADQLSYIETHGTGTALGDPIEMEALKAVLGAATADSSPCFLGAVKTNIGHLEAASGIAGLIKAVQCFAHQAIPGNLHFANLNPRLTLADCRLVIPTATTAWPRGARPRLCGISSFGFSGTNAHLVLQEPPLAAASADPITPRPAYSLPISAKSPQALRELVARYAALLSGDTTMSLTDLLYTAGQRRTHHLHRLAVVGATAPELGAALQAHLAGALPGNVVTGCAPTGLSRPVIFVFPGQGSQWVGMAAALLDSEPVFRAAMERIDALAHSHTGWSILQELAAPATSSRLAFTEVAQPVLFAVSVALSALYFSMGVRPDAVLGHSVGEIAAAHVAGILTLEEAVRLVCLRGRVMSGLHGLGKMAAVSIGQTEAEDVLRRTGGAVSLAAINAPDSVVLSGDPQALDELLKELSAQGHKCKLLDVEYAFHSQQMRQVEASFLAALGPVVRSSGTTAMFSTVSGQPVQGPELDGEHWRRNLVDPVRFADAIHCAAQQQNAVFIEVGPHPVLSAPIARTLELHNTPGQVLATLRRGQGESSRVLQTVASLYVGGYSPDWRSINGTTGRLVALPAYPWQHQRYWVGQTTPVARSARHNPESYADWFYTQKWNPRPFPQPSRASQARSQRFLILADRSGVGAAVAAELQAAGNSCLMLYAEEQGAATKRVAQALATSPAFHGVIYFWGVDSPSPEAISAATPASEAWANSAALLAVLPQLLSGAGARLWIVSRGAQSVGNAQPSLAHAPLWGLGRVLSLEQPAQWGGLIDLAPTPGPLEARQVAALIASVPAEDQFALRGDQLYVPRLGAQTMAPAGQPLQLAAERTYLVTGGLGGLGLQLARWLVQRGARQLLLLSRRSIDERGAGTQQTAALAELRAQGAAVHIAAVDVANRPALEKVLATLTHPLGGVIHAAGVATTEPLVSAQASQSLQDAFQAKVHGTWTLHELTRELPLDFFIGMSSAAAIWGGQGLGHYAAANQFLDAVMHHRRALGLPGTSINWGLWAGRGMGSGAGGEQLTGTGLHAMPPALALQALERVLQSGVAQQTIAAVDWVRFKALYETQPRRKLLEQIAAAGEIPAVASAGRADSQAATQLRTLAPAARHAAVEAMIRAELARQLGLPSERDIPSDRPLRELGLDSLMAVSLRDALVGAVGVPLPATVAFDHPTVQALSRQILILLEAAAPPAAPGPTDSPARSDDPIAIIGIGCRYPGGVSDPESFWRVVAQGLDTITEIPRERWNLADHYDPDPEVPGKTTSRTGGFLPNVDQFDAAFFGISPREAMKMDPQQRLLLETSWEALERAGLPAARLLDSATGVFVGLIHHEYAHLNGFDLAHYDGYAGTGSTGSVASGRISYFLGLKGPSLTVDTACSSSLVTIHLACQSLRLGECSLALSGGVTLMLTPATHVEFSRLRGLAADGRCKSFDAAADGVGWSEGCGMLVLKRLTDAERDGDPILAVIRGTAVNQDGRSNGLTAPNGPSQEAVIRRALRSAGVSPAAVDYVEAHGTGTSLGDPIEVQALGAALHAGRSQEQPLVVGSVKSNFGHTQAAAGVAGVINTVLAMRHSLMPRTLHFQTPNPRIAWAELTVTVASRPVPWDKSDKPRIAGVSAFGLSGTNAHVILQEAPADARAATDSPAPTTYLLPLSAKSEPALIALAHAYGAVLSAAKGDALADIVYSASVRRSHHSHRLAVVGETAEQLADQLSQWTGGQSSAGLFHGQTVTGESPKLVFVFPGQGWQWVGMGRQLLAERPAFRTALQACDVAIQREAGFSILAELVRDRDDDLPIQVLQPLLFACQVGLAAEWRAAGVTPDAVVGHSMGEVAAAHVAGALTLHDAVRIICRRSALMRRLSGKGAMALVELSLDDAQAALRGYDQLLSIAASNGPRSTVIAGEPAALDEVLAALEQRAVFCRRIKVEVASHCPQMDELTAELRAALAEISGQPASLRMVSTVIGQELSGPELTAEYWVRNVREPVQFSSVIHELISSGHHRFVELSAHPILTPSLQECLREGGLPGLVVGSGRRDSDEDTSLKESLAALYADGYELDWELQFPLGGKVVDLPSYPWQRERYWLETNQSGAKRFIPGTGGQSAAQTQTTTEATAGSGGDKTEQGETAETRLLLGQRWQISPLPVESSPAPASRGAWLLLADTTGLADRVQQLLLDRGEEVVRLDVPQLSSLAEPLPDYDFDAALRRTVSEGVSCKGVIHLWGVADPALAPPTTDELSAAQTLGCGSALQLLQALSRTGWRHTPRLFLVTRATQRVEQEPTDLLPTHAPLWALGRTIVFEQPELRCARIDLAPNSASEEAATLLRELLSDSREDEVALRGEHRYVSRLARLTAHELPPLPPEIAQRTVHAEATYLIAGGLGGLGLLTAQWLSEQGARHLLLVSRSGVTSPQQSAALSDLQRAGVDVVVAQADIADPTALAALLQDADDRQPPLRGVFHTAGVLEDGLLINQDWERCRRVFAPKVRGAWNLHLQTANRELDFFVLYSSAAALFGAPGLGNYVAANAFLDALALYRQQRGLPAVSINWGLFAGIGMGNKAERAGQAQARGMHAIPPEQGAAALRSLLASTVAQVGVVAFDTRQWLDFHPLAARSERFTLLLTESRQVHRGRAARSQALERRLHQASPAERLRIIEQLVRERAAAVLRMDAARLDPRAPFRSLGIDSVMGLELRNRLESELGLTLSAALIWIYPNAGALAAYLAGELATELPSQTATPTAEAPPSAPPEPDQPPLTDDDLLAAFDASMSQLERQPKR